MLGFRLFTRARPCEPEEASVRLLAMTLHEAKRLGIRRVLVCCDQDNPASARVIQKNGGVFESEVEHQTGFIVDRYWIDQ